MFMDINDDMRNKREKLEKWKGYANKLAISQLLDVQYYQFGTRLMLRHNKNFIFNSIR